MRVLRGRQDLCGYADAPPEVNPTMIEKDCVTRSFMLNSRQEQISFRFVTF